ncbi:hypothetical protein CGRA01v4_09262 [Colletotrichum graminicola]|nr:hypothetical protein CGRA01v4_09262 [Colletotrichum graminicola]
MALLAFGQEFRVFANKTCDVPCIESFRSSPELLAVHHIKSSQDVAAAAISMSGHISLSFVTVLPHPRAATCLIHRGNLAFALHLNTA